MAGDFEALVAVTEELIARLDASEEDLRRQALAQLRVAMTRPADNPDIVAAHLHAADVIARKLDDDRLATQVQATAARFALATGELEHAEELARRSLAWAERAGLNDATEVALISLEVLGRRERMRDLAAATAIFQRAVESPSSMRRRVGDPNVALDLVTSALGPQAPAAGEAAESHLEAAFGRFDLVRELLGSYS